MRVDERRVDQSPPSPADELTELDSLLEMHGVEVERWGKGSAKRLEDLVAEFDLGECTLLCDEEGRLVREVAVVGVDVLFTDRQCGSLRLVESEQTFRSGRKRHRKLRTSIAEKRLPGESAADAAKRAIAEELGLPVEDLELLLSGFEVTAGSSGSFPGLWSRRRLTYFQCELPAVLFECKGYVERQPDKTTHFSWQPTASADEEDKESYALSTN